MPLIPVVALKVFPYAGKRKVQGDRFEVSQQDAKILKALGFIKDAPALKPSELSLPVSRPDVLPESLPPAPRPASPETKDETPESAPKTRTYRRRDLTAEGE